MLRRLKRLREAWKLTDTLQRNGPIHTPQGDVLTPEEIKKMLEVDLPLGDGKAEFLGGPMTEDEYKKFEYEEEQGWGEELRKKLFKKPDNA